MANPDKSNDTNERLAAAMELMAQTQATTLANAPRRRLSFAEWQAKQPKHEMPFPVFQNGYRIEATQVTPAQIALLPKLREGRFFDRRIHVYRDQTPDRGWHIDYPNRAMSDRMTMSNYGRDLTEILQRLTTETPDIT